MIALLAKILRQKGAAPSARERALARMAKAEPELIAGAEADAAAIFEHTLSALPDELVVAILLHRADRKSAATAVLEGETSIAEGLAVLAIALTEQQSNRGAS